MEAPAPERVKSGEAEQNKRLLFVVTEGWAFLRHRLPMAQAAQSNGFEVAVATQTGATAPDIESYGIRVFPIAVRRASFSPLADLRYMIGLRRICLEFQPDLVHNVSIKPILYGTLAARSAGVQAILNAFTGMSILFHENRNGGPPVQPWKGKLFLGLLRRVAGKGRTHYLVQNGDDERFVREHLSPDQGRLHLIPGSGVDTAAFSPRPEPPDENGIVATLVGRLLWSKGLNEFAAAAKILRDRRTPVRMVLVGSPDPANPTSVSESDLTDWVRAGLIEWWGEQSDIPGVWAKSHIAVLPSYREGLPKSLLEAAACGRPMVATDVPGCREIVRHGETGLLCPQGEPGALADAIEMLAKDREQRRSLGAAARLDVEQRLSAAVIGSAISDLYGRLTTDRGTGP